MLGSRANTTVLNGKVSSRMTSALITYESVREKEAKDGP